MLIVPLLLLAGLAGCAGDAARQGSASSGEGPGAPAAELPVGRTFVSTGVSAAGQPKPLVTGTSITLSIPEAGRIVVRAGCNTGSGAARVENGALVVDDLATTEMGCDQALHQQDEWVTGFFRGRPAWKLAGADLTLTGPDLEVRMSDQAAQGAAVALVGTKWTVDTLVSGDAASSVPAGATAFMTFTADGRVTGSTGCNSFGGNAPVDGDRITFGDLITTRRACDGALGALEADVLRVLEGTVTYRIESRTLVLEASNGTGLRLTG